MKYFDNHTHTNYEPLIEELPNIIQINNANDLGMNIVGCNIESSKLAINQALKINNAYCTIGLHPDTVNANQDANFEINKLIKLYEYGKEKIIAIGECGLDYYYKSDDVTKKLQEQLFVKQIELAKKLNLPIMMHIRDAHSDAIKIIERYKNDNLKFIVHCFSGNLDDLNKYLSLNCYISVGGTVTFKNNDSFREVVKQIPLNHLLTETDAPWLAPVPFRGKTNYPYYVIEVNKYLSELFKIDLNKFNEILINNVFNVFNLKC